MDFAGSTHSRRDMLALLGGAALLGAMPGRAQAQAEPTEALVLHDSRRRPRPTFSAIGFRC